MVPLDQIREPVTADFLVGFTDIRGFLRITEVLTDSRAIFDFMDAVARISSRALDGTSGRIIKFIGDATMVLFPGEDADAGVSAMLGLKDAVDAHMAERGFDSRIRVGLHYGEATIGPFGPDRRLDVLGQTVNVASGTLSTKRQADFVITPEAFQRLSPQSRKAFRTADWTPGDTLYMLSS